MFQISPDDISLKDRKDQHSVENVEMDQEIVCHAEIVENEQFVYHAEIINPSQYSQELVNDNSNTPEKNSSYYNGRVVMRNAFYVIATVLIVIAIILCIIFFLVVPLSVGHDSSDPSSEPTTTCPTGWIQFRTNCYKFSITSGIYNTWTDCQATCSGIDANMLCVENAEQNSFIWANVAPINTWIGYQDLNNYPNFVWNSGCTSSYTNWHPNDPDNYLGVEWYAVIASEYDYGGLWGDLANTHAERYWVPNFVVGCSCQKSLVDQN